jgi:hypothetical protein
MNRHFETLRLRERACKFGDCVVLTVNGLSRAGTRGHYLVFLVRRIGRRDSA